MIKSVFYIKSIDEMIAFIEKTKNFFGSPEDYENYFGFERNWDENTGEILETVKEYYNRGGVFTNIPEKYPCELDLIGIVKMIWNGFILESK